MSHILLVDDDEIFLQVLQRAFSKRNYQVKTAVNISEAMALGRQQHFDQAVVDIETEAGTEVARVNGYISSMSATDDNVDGKIIKVNIRFVDNDPEKFEFLSRYISQTRT